MYATSGVLSLITRVHEHDALVARTDVKIILAHVHTACRVRTLLYLAILGNSKPLLSTLLADDDDTWRSSLSNALQNRWLC